MEEQPNVAIDEFIVTQTGKMRRILDARQYVKSFKSMIHPSFIIFNSQSHRSFSGNFVSNKSFICDPQRIRLGGKVRFS
jgi:hypothetical protein